MTIETDRVLEKYVDTYGIQSSIELLSVIADQSAGGKGYTVKPTAMIDFDGYDVSHQTKLIRLDSTNFGFERKAVDLADDLEEALNVEFRKSHASVGSRIGWGSFSIVVGVVETVVGVIGIIVPEPGTTVGGVVMVSLGANSLVDGFSQLAGANNGHGINILGEGAAVLGGSIAELSGKDTKVGEAAGKGIFAVTSIALGAWGSVRILKVPNAKLFNVAKGAPLNLGRVDLLYASGRSKDGMTIISINNNAGQSILRFVTHDGALQANARIGKVMQGSKIIEGSHVMRHTGMGKDMVKGLLKMASHGALKGL